jgi:hypothetical protein
MSAPNRITILISVFEQIAGERPVGLADASAIVARATEDPAERLHLEEVVTRILQRGESGRILKGFLTDTDMVDFDTSVVSQRSTTGTQPPR